MAPFLIVGEALIDVVETTAGTRTLHPGGSPANVAVTVGRLGHRPDLLTWIADDEHGRHVREHLASSGVNVLPQSLGAERTSTAWARVDRAGVPTYDFDLLWELAQWTVGPEIAVVHAGSIAALAPTRPPNALAALLAAAREHAILTYDPNLRPAIMGAPGDVRDQVEELVAVVDVVKVSDEDLAWLHPHSDPGDLVARWVEDHALALGILTRGSAGPLAVLPGGDAVEVPAPAVTVVDTVGAGDSFMGALLHALDARGLTGARARPQLHSMTVDDVVAVLTFATQVAAITVGRPGADPPRLAELSGVR